MEIVVELRSFVGTTEKEVFYPAVSEMVDLSLELLVAVFITVQIWLPGIKTAQRKAIFRERETQIPKNIPEY